MATYNWETMLGKSNIPHDPYDTSKMIPISSYTNPNVLKPGVSGLYSSKSWLDPYAFAQQASNFTKTMPMPDKPVYNAPSIDPNRVEFLAQQMAAPERASLEDEVQRIISRSASNPVAGRMATREALTGYGKGLGNIMGNAQRGGLTQATAEMQPLMAKAEADWKTDMEPWRYAQREQQDVTTKLLENILKGATNVTAPLSTYATPTYATPAVTPQLATSPQLNRKDIEKQIGDALIKQGATVEDVRKLFAGYGG